MQERLRGELKIVLVSSKAVDLGYICEYLRNDSNDLWHLIREPKGGRCTRGVFSLTIAATMKRSSSPRFRVTKVRETSRAMTNIIASTVKVTPEPRSWAPLFWSPPGGGFPRGAVGVDIAECYQGRA